MTSQHQEITAAVQEHAPEVRALMRRLDDIADEAREAPEEVRVWTRATATLLTAYDALVKE